MLRDVYLHGQPGRDFGRHFQIDVASPAEALRALFVLRPHLRAVMRDLSWRVIVGPPHISNSIDVNAVGMNLGSQALHLYPTVAVGGGDGAAVGKIILGVVLIGAAIFLMPAAGLALGAGLTLTAMQVAMIGGAMLLGGVAMLLSQPPTPEKTEQQMRPEDRPSFMFNGTVNNSQEGSCVPLLYGLHLTGSVVINAGITIEDIVLW